MNSERGKKILILSISIAAVVAVSGAFVFGAYEMRQMRKENGELRSSLEKNTPNAQEETALSATTTEMATSSLQDGKEDIKEEKKIPEKEIIYVTKKVMTTETEAPKSAPPEVVAAAAPTPAQVVAPVVVTESQINVVAIRQTQYPDGYGGTYGAYEIELSINASAGEILVPQSTSDTIGTGNIGFSYSIVGEEFRGIQDSKVTCPITTENFCKFKNDGKTRTLLTTVFLTPSQEGTGNYGVLFESLNYFENGEPKKLDINRKTATINVMY